jgi:hypothetical protein
METNLYERTGVFSIIAKQQSGEKVLVTVTVLSLAKGFEVILKAEDGAAIFHAD